jgi:hypothetical protein
MANFHIYEARLLATTTKTRPQAESISSRNLLKYLPFVDMQGPVYRVNRRQVLELRSGHITFFDDEEGIPTIYTESLNQIPSFSKITDPAILELIKAEAEPVTFEKKEKIFEPGDTPTALNIIVSGKVSFYEEGQYHFHNAIGHSGPGEFFAESGLGVDSPTFKHTGEASTNVATYKIEYADVISILTDPAQGGKYDSYLADHIAEVKATKDKTNRKGEALIKIDGGYHADEPEISSTYVA